MACRAACQVQLASTDKVDLEALYPKAETVIEAMSTYLFQLARALRHLTLDMYMYLTFLIMQGRTL